MVEKRKLMTRASFSCHFMTQASVIFLIGGVCVPKFAIFCCLLVFFLSKNADYFACLFTPSKGRTGEHI